MNCRYCSMFQNAKWRVAPDPDDTPTKKKDKARLRHCPVVAKYINDAHEKCDQFVPHNKFWCDNNECWIAVDACIYRKNKGADDACNNCRQFAIIVNLKRLIGFMKRKMEASAEKPVLKLRK